MADTIASQYMGLPVPVPTVDPGAQYATDLNSCLTLVDQHDHSSGKGTSVTPAGLNINSALAFGSNDATGLRSTRFVAQASPLSGGSDIGCTYVSGLDLYYNDINGNQVRLTASGAVAGTPGSIGSLTSPASVTYNAGAGSYTFQSDVNTPGSLDAGTVVVREMVANGKGISLTAPAALAANYSLTFPGSLPASQRFVTIDASGNVAASWNVDNSTVEISSNLLQVKDGGITNAKLGALGQQISSLVTFDSTNTSTPYLVSGLTVTITTTGRPVQVCLRSGTSGGVVEGSTSSATGFVGAVGFYNNGTLISASEIIGKGAPDATPALSIGLPPSAFSFVDVQAAGTYTYTVKIWIVGTSSVIAVANLYLMAYPV